MYGVLCVDILGKERDLGTYRTVDEAINALELLKNFLLVSNLPIFEMPAFAELTEEKENV